MRVNEMPCGGLEAGHATVAELLATLHEPVDVVLGDAEVVFEHAAQPDGGGHLVLGDAHALTLQVSGNANAGVGVVAELSMHEATGREYRQRHGVVPPGPGDDVRGDGQGGDVELVESELTPVAR